MVPIKWTEAARALGRLLWALVTLKPILAPEEVVEERKAVCSGCEFFREGQCTVCSCFVGLKARLYHERCPKKKWKKVFVWGLLTTIFKKDAD